MQIVTKNEQGSYTNISQNKLQWKDFIRDKDIIYHKRIQYIKNI